MTTYDEGTERDMSTDGGRNEHLGTADIAGTTRSERDDTMYRQSERTGRVEHTAPEDRVALFSEDDSSDFEHRWTDVQTQFVDDPRDAVESADELVAEVMQTLATRFAEQKQALERGWHDEGEIDTEELRLAMRQYRSFFHRLLAA